MLKGLTDHWPMHAWSGADVLWDIVNGSCCVTLRKDRGGLERPEESRLQGDGTTQRDLLQRDTTHVIFNVDYSDLYWKVLLNQRTKNEALKTRLLHVMSILRQAGSLLVVGSCPA